MVLNRNYFCSVIYQVTRVKYWENTTKDSNTVKMAKAVACKGNVSEIIDLNKSAIKLLER